MCFIFILNKGFFCRFLKPLSSIPISIVDRFNLIVPYRQDKNYERDEDGFADVWGARGGRRVPGI
jgi:hypothetical protein